MTIITVASLEGRLTIAERCKLAETLTDAVLVPEVGQPAPAARRGFQVRRACSRLPGDRWQAFGRPRDQARRRVIDEGSWGSRGGVLSILDLLDAGVFTADRVAAIRQVVR